MPDQVDPDTDNEAHNSGLVTDPSSDPDSDEASYGSSLIKAEPFGTEEIPDSERHGKPSSQFTLWFAANMVLAVLVSGFFAASFGLTIVQGISAVAVGSFAGALVMGLLAGIGARFGVPQQVQARGPMGYFANFIPIALLTNVSAIDWVAVNTVFAVLALQALFNIPFWIGAAVMFIAQALFAIWGHNLIHLLNKIATVVLTILFAIITVLALSKIEFSSAPLGGGEQGGLPEWITFAGFFFIYVMTWTPFASDFSRYLPRKTSHAKIVGFTTGGSFLSLLWLGSIGVLVSSFAGDLGAVEALAELTGSWAPLAMITIVLSTIPVSAMNLYGGSISLLTLRIPVSRAGAVVITAVLSYGLTLLMQSDPYGSFYDFLLLLGYLVVPFTTVLLADYFIRTKHMGTQALVELADTNRIVAWGFVSWIIGCLVSSLFWSTPFGDGPWHSLVAGAGEVTYYIGAAASLISYIVIHLARKKNPDATMVYRKAS